MKLQLTAPGTVPQCFCSHSEAQSTVMSGTQSTVMSCYIAVKLLYHGTVKKCFGISESQVPDIKLGTITHHLAIMRVQF